MVFFLPPPAASQFDWGTVVNKLFVWGGSLFWTSVGGGGYSQRPVCQTCGCTASVPFSECSHATLCSPSPSTLQEKWTLSPTRLVWLDMCGWLKRGKGGVSEEEEESGGRAEGPGRDGARLHVKKGEAVDICGDSRQSPMGTQARNSPPVLTL